MLLVSAIAIEAGSSPSKCYRMVGVPTIHCWGRKSTESTWVTARLEATRQWLNAHQKAQFISSSTKSSSMLLVKSSCFVLSVACFARRRSVGGGHAFRLGALRTRSTNL